MQEAFESFTEGLRIATSKESRVGFGRVPSPFPPSPSSLPLPSARTTGNATMPGFSRGTKLHACMGSSFPLSCLPGHCQVCRQHIGKQGGVLEGGLAVNSAFCSFGRPELSWLLAPILDSSQSPVTPAPRIQHPLLASEFTSLTCTDPHT